MNVKAIGAALVAAGLTMTAAAQGGSGAAPQPLLERAIEAMGGRERLASLKTLKIDAIGHNFALEQSERPEGPWLATYTQRVEERDVSGRRRWVQMQSRNWNFAGWSPASAMVVAKGVAARQFGERWLPGAAQDLDDAAEAFELGPERLLLTAHAAADLRRGASTTLQGVPHDAVTFSWRGRRVTLHLNAWTHLPTLLEIVRPDRLQIWGDVTTKRWYSYWTLERGGLMYPRQITTEWNGLPSGDETVMKIEIDAALDEARFAIPADVTAAFEKAKDVPSGLPAMHVDPKRAIDVADGVLQLAGSWNVLVVRQPDGLVVIECPISSRYSTEVLDELKKRYPDVPVKAVVTTSDAWPHIAGAREYVARRVPIHALDLNVPILDRLVRAPRSTDRDLQASTPQSPAWRRIGDRATIGTGDTRLELLPIRGELGERMAAVWMPGRRLLYASDMLQRNRDGSFFMPSMLAEIEALVRREKLDPERAVAMHLAPTPWPEITAALEKARMK
ncbi:MAG TPA: hypothetical protein VFO19_07115 [Vicinamibacterales bacterium]|nr:hypothetical protein [Vicinamibacterales bacterium]